MNRSSTNVTFRLSDKLAIFTYQYNYSLSSLVSSVDTTIFNIKAKFWHFNTQ